MPSFPTDQQLPTDLRDALRTGGSAGQKRLLCWLFREFRDDVDEDLLAVCLLEMAARLASRAAPKRPVGLFRTILFRRRRDSWRSSSARVSVRAAISRRLDSVSSDDPATQAEQRDLSSRIRTAVNSDLDPAAAIIVQAWANGLSFPKIARAAEERLHEPWTAARARGALRRSISKLRSRFET